MSSAGNNRHQGLGTITTVVCGLGARFVLAEQAWREGAHFRRSLMSNKIDITVPNASVYYCYRADRSVDCICCRNMISIRRPRASSKVGCERRGNKRRDDRMFEDKIVERVVCGSIGRRRGKSEELDSSVVACRSKIFIRRVECNPFHMTLMNGKSL